MGMGNYFEVVIPKYDKRLSFILHDYKCTLYSGNSSLCYWEKKILAAISLWKQYAMLESVRSVKHFALGNVMYIKEDIRMYRIAISLHIL